MTSRVGAIARRSAGLWGPAAFAAASLLGARRQPGYRHAVHHVSGLAAHGAPSAPVMIAGFGALGTAGLVMASGDRAVDPVLRVAGAATLAAGALRCSTPECPTPFVDDDVTPGDAGHAVASMVAFACWVALPAVGAARPGPRWYRRASAALAVTTALGWAAAGATTRRGSSRRGLAQRAFLASAFCWHGATSVRALRSSGGGTGP